MKIFIASTSAVVLGLAYFLNNEIPGFGIDSYGIYAHCREIGMARLGLWLTPLLVALASIAALLRMREKERTATTGDKKQGSDSIDIFGMSQTCPYSCLEFETYL